MVSEPHRVARIRRPGWRGREVGTTFLKIACFERFSHELGRAQPTLAEASDGKVSNTYGGNTVKMTLVFVLLLSSLPAFAQSNYAVLSGTVLDPERRAIAGASIQLTAVATHAERAVTSNEEGIFQIPGLLPGDYKLTVKAPGFAEPDLSLRLEVGQQLSLEVILKLGSIANAVEVTTDLEMLDKTDASGGEVIEPTSLANLPPNGRRLSHVGPPAPRAHLRR